MEQLFEFISNHVLLWTAFAAILVMTIRTEFSHQAISKFRISPAVAVRHINNEDTLVLDMRDENDYKTGHLQGALYTPAQELAKQIEKNRDNKSRPILLYCRSGNFSAKACRDFHKSGFTSVYTMDGGIMNWISENLPVVKK